MEATILELTVILRPLEPRPKSYSDTPLLAHISLANISSVKMFPFLPSHVRVVYIRSI